MNKSLVDFEIDLRGIEVLREWKSIENACGGDDSKCRCRLCCRYAYEGVLSLFRTRQKKDSNLCEICHDYIFRGVFVVL